MRNVSEYGILVALLVALGAASASRAESLAILGMGAPESTPSATSSLPEVTAGQLETLEGAQRFLGSQVDAARQAEFPVASRDVLLRAIEQASGPYPSIPAELQATLQALREGAAELVEPADQQRYLFAGLHEVEVRAFAFAEGSRMAYGSAAACLLEASGAGVTGPGASGAGALATSMETLVRLQVPAEPLWQSGLELHARLTRTALGRGLPEREALDLAGGYLHLLTVSLGQPMQGAPMSVAGIHCNAAAAASHALMGDADAEARVWVLEAHARLVTEWPGEFDSLSGTLREALAIQEGEDVQARNDRLYRVMSGPYPVL